MERKKNVLSGGGGVVRLQQVHLYAAAAATPWKPVIFPMCALIPCSISRFFLRLYGMFLAMVFFYICMK